MMSHEPNPGQISSPEVRPVAPERKTERSNASKYMQKQLWGPGVATSWGDTRGLHAIKEHEHNPLH